MYHSTPDNGEPNIIRAKQIPIEERISTLVTIVQKSVQDFKEQMQKYATDINERVKRAANAMADYGFV